MDHETVSTLRPPTKLDYSLTGESAARAIERGLAEAEWYQTPVPRATMRKLLERRDGPAIRDTLIWFGLILGAAYATWALWGSWWAAIPYLIYATLYASTADSRWHEAGHGTAFKTDWLNNALYEIASFMVMRESTVWRWSHTRHHSDTIIVGRDPEIAVPRPPNLWGLMKSFFALPVYPGYFKAILAHSFGKMSAHERTFIPASEFPKVFRKARLYVLIYATAVALAIATRSFLPVLYLGLTHIFGTWLMLVYGLTQHTGLAENVLDHRLNCRTVRMNFVNRFLYWNMNYHVEHHMFPLVPYHALPQLHAAVKHDMPAPYPSLWDAWSEIIPAVLKQVKDPAYHVKRTLPAKHDPVGEVRPVSAAEPTSDGWIEVCAAADLGQEDVIRFDHRRKSYALIRNAAGVLHATDGFCTHGNVHLSDGWVKGDFIECPKHNGRFFLADGSPARAPICRGLGTYPIEERAGRLWLNVAKVGGSGARASTPIALRIVSTRNVSTFIRELEVEPVDATLRVNFTPGDYLQVEIPTYEEIRFRDFDIPEPYASVWRTQHVFDLVARNREAGRRNNYSLASNAKHERVLRFNVRLATPPPGQDCPPGVGSAYMFSLKAGDTISAIGPFGDFHLKPTQREAVYIGGGAGMAPLRAHLSHLFETEHTKRKVSFWYGARSKQELFYEDYFRGLEAVHRNFSFHVALSSPLASDAWTGPAGFIHEIVLEDYLRAHPEPKAVEYYLCGPPMMIKAVTKMLADLGVPTLQIAFDEF
ncbi:NADH:ubiquinone reductase (Na(+)-transporting) subunit F [Oleiharenicola lentus]|uniref:NADH:ubiquinone reductase (Na(+)-transporting) subunit F n=1 Tax=Oleiharenicola lentus TaxID=2508720 RepID=UPI003F67FBB7